MEANSVLSAREISAIENKIGYTFKEKRLLCKAFTHSSYVNENKGAVHNERLEFFGDRILNFLASERLFFNQQGGEGKLTEHLKNMVSHLPLTKSVDKLKIKEYLKMSKGAKADGKIISDLYEALMGAIYADSGSIEECRKFFDFSLVTVKVTDYKSILKEWCEKNKKTQEKSFEEIPNGTKKQFKALLAIENQSFTAQSGSKDEAEKKAAQKACEFFNIEV